MKKYQSLGELKKAVENGVLVNWQNGLYYVKIDFEGDFVIKCTNTPMQEILSDKHDLNDFFTSEPNTEKFARKDSVTGQGINEGFCFNDGEFYCLNQTEAEKYAEKIGYKNLEEAYKNEAYYWTEWNDEDDFQYQMINGVLTEIEN